MPAVPSPQGTEAFRRRSLILPSLPKLDTASRRRSVIASPAIQNASKNGEYFPVMRRHWSSLQDHAAHLASGFDSAAVTPSCDERREGFNWDTPQEMNMYPDQHPRKPSAREPKGTARIWRQESEDLYRRGSVAVLPPCPMPPSPLRTQSTAATDQRLSRTDTGLSSTKVARTDTGRSSVSTLEKGPRRAIPDIRTFDPDPHDEPLSPEPISPKAEVKPSRTFSFKLSSAMKKGRAEDKVQKHAQFSETTKSPAKSSSRPNSSRDIPKGGLKDRRKLEQTETLKLTLPLDSPGLTARGRSPIPKVIESASITRPRRGSPRTPWIRDAPPTPPDEDSEPEEHKPTPKIPPGSGVLVSSLPSPSPCPLTGRQSRRKRNSFGASDSTAARTSESTNVPAEKAIVDRREPTQLERKGSKRWRLPRGRSPKLLKSNTDAETKHLSFSRALRKSVRKRRSAFKPVPIPSRPTLPSPGPFTKETLHKNRSESISQKDHLANMPMPPPTFTPPGLSRIPTPPMAGEDDDVNQQGDVKGKLEGFYFDVIDVRQPKSSHGARGGLWDSDALLMSQEGGFTPSNSDSDESPQASHAPTPSPAEPANVSPTAYMTLTPPPISGLLEIPRSITPLSGRRGTLGQDPYFRVKLSRESTRDSLDEEERAKFEWMTPEHLPSSPLCPLHTKYRGPYGGTCIYHERLKAVPIKVGTVSPVSSTSGNTSPASLVDVFPEGKSKRTRRLVSLSSP